MEFAKPITKCGGAFQIDFGYRLHLFDPVRYNPELASGFHVILIRRRWNQGRNAGALFNQILLCADTEQAAGRNAVQHLEASGPLSVSILQIAPPLSGFDVISTMLLTCMSY